MIMDLWCVTINNRDNRDSMAVDHVTAWITSRLFLEEKKLLGLYLIRESAVLPLNLVCVVQS